MKINRWSAELAPTENMIKHLFISEGLDPQEVLVPSGTKMSHCRTRMTEIIQVAHGEIIFNLSGTQFALRVGDRLEMAANTQYSYSNMKSETSTFYTGMRV
jgi:quercetin dioxygenase-like cupin family protein